MEQLLPRETGSWRKKRCKERGPCHVSITGLTFLHSKFYISNVISFALWSLYYIWRFCRSESKDVREVFKINLQSLKEDTTVQIFLLMLSLNKIIPKRRRNMYKKNIATGKMSQAITPFHLFHYFNFSNFHHETTFPQAITFSQDNFFSQDDFFSLYNFFSWDNFFSLDYFFSPDYFFPQDKNFLHSITFSHWITFLTE